MVKQSSITDSLLFKINDELNMKTRLKSGSVTSICKTSTKMSSTLHATVLYCIISEYVSFERQWVISSFLNDNIYLNFCIGLQICNSNPIIHCTKWVFSSISGAKKPNWVWLSIFLPGRICLELIPFLRGWYLWGKCNL